ncbi:MAG: GH3 auxin-responsive promoter family protein, partial [Bacillota bacterium]|nr:GH3 auxin-responsive promoter family protein [Bacillota bacterium]
GKKYSFDKINSIEEFKKQVPIVTYPDLEPYVNRIYYNNEQNVLCSDRVIGFATSSGSIGKPKIIPRTDVEIGIYTKYTVTRFLALAKQYGKARGIGHIPARGICTLCQHKELSPFGLPATNVADIAAKKYYSIYPYILILPLKRQFSADEIDILYGNVRFGLEDKNCLYIFSVFAKNIEEIFSYMKEHHEMLVKDIREGTIDESVRMKPEIREALQRTIKPNPKRAAELEAEFAKGFDETIAKRLWPNLMVISAIGTSKSFEGFVETVKKYTKDVPFDYSIYGASEGLMAAAYKSDEVGQLMLPDSCYFEFVEDTGDEAKEITETLFIDQLEVGKKYEVILTNQSGFYRYRINDIIKVLGYEGKCPVINFVYRRGQLLNINGEKTNMEQMSEAMARLEKDAGVHITEWAVFVNKGKDQFRYAVLIENEEGKDLSGLTDIFEQHLRDVNTSYYYYETVKGLIDPPVIYNQRPGSHKEWIEYKVSTGATREQIKPVRILDNDEKIGFFTKRIEWPSPTKECRIVNEL